MTIPRFGNVMPIHCDVLALIGWRLSRGDSGIASKPSDRIAIMQEGQDRLVAETGVDFGYDLEMWREYLLEAEEHEYTHPYAYQSVDDEVRRAISDPDFQRHAELAAKSSTQS